MNAKLEQGAAASPADIAKYVMAVLAVLAGVVGFYWFSALPGPLRGLLLIGTLVAAAAIFAFTARGRLVIEFLSESRFELRKVVWPTRNETVRATGVIMLVVVLLSLILALIDLILSSAVRWLLG